MWWVVSVPCLSFYPVTPAPCCIYCSSDLKWGGFCLYINNNKIMRKRAVCQNQLRSTSQCLPAKDRTLCWAYSGVSFQDDSGDNCSNWTKQLLPHISSFQAGESPAGTNRKEHSWPSGVREQVTLSWPCAANQNRCGWVQRMRVQPGTEAPVDLVFQSP